MSISNRILVVEDNKTINNFLVEYLKKYGFLPDSACTYEAAVTLLKRENYDLIVLDFKLDKGKMAIDLLSFIDKVTKVIFLDSKPIQTTNKTTYLHKGIYGHIPRAFKGEELALKARVLLNSALLSKIV